jgi:hypothetical protein
MRPAVVIDRDRCVIDYFYDIVRDQIVLIEYLYSYDKSIVSQMDIGLDVEVKYTRFNQN